MNDGARSTVLLLGTEHFVSRRDLYKPELKDMLLPGNQKEILQVVGALAAFAPTRVAVEHDFGSIDALNAQYRSYLDGAFELGPDETHQLAFRLAKQCGLEKIDAINAWGRYYEGAGEEDIEPYARAAGQEDTLERFTESLKSRFASWDARMTTMSLWERLLVLNGQEWLRDNLGSYMDGYLRLGSAQDPRGADFISGWWFNRNLRIFRNIRDLTDEPGARVFILIGAGHIPILRQCVEAAWDLDLAEVSDYL